MKVPMRWITRYCDIKDDPHSFASRMTMTGTMCEGYELEGAAISGVVTGRILSVEPHRDSDHLRICQLDIGSGSRQIVTGAANVQPGQVVPVALDGAKLPGGEIHTGTLRGVQSQGMMCSIGELGLTLHDCPDCIEDGIMILPDDTPLGLPITEVMGMDDYIFEFEITSNRVDCYGVEGIAREAAVTYGVPFNFPKPRVERTHGELGSTLTVRNDTPENCLRYTGAVVKNVRVKPSPKWMRTLLRQAGVRPINNIVDITNFVMLEYNQPMHAFDLRFVKDGGIVVRQAKQGEALETLDGVVRKLDPSMMVIADSEKAIAVAGVMGGEFSSIVDDTNSVIFESACFRAQSVRSTAKALGMRTDASSRYDKGLDPENTMPALMRALELVEQLDAGDVVGGFVDVRGVQRELPVIPFQPERINRFLGAEIDRGFMLDVLRRLEFTVSQDESTVTPPSFRGDIEGFADVAEEVARFYGYDRIPVAVQPTVPSALPTPIQRFQRQLRQLSVAGGYYEINSPSFMSQKQLDQLLVPKDHPLRRGVHISNPLGEDTSYMRTTIIPAMLEILSRNYNSRAESAALFEIGSEYLPYEGSPDGLPKEPDRLIYGGYGEVDFYSLKGMAQEIASTIGAGRLTFRRQSEIPWFHPGRTADILCGGQKIGVVGEIHPTAAENYGIKTRVAVMELSVEQLFALRRELKYQGLPRFPAVTRDLSLVCDERSESGSIEQVIRDCCGELLEKITVFDVYRGAGIDPGSKSIAYSLTLRGRDRTLTDSEVDSAIALALKALEEKGIRIRS